MFVGLCDTWLTVAVSLQVAADPDLKYLAQRAFVSYTRSVYLQPNKEVGERSRLILSILLIHVVAWLACLCAFGGPGVQGARAAV